MANGRTHTKIAGTADYDDPAFWDTKFATGQDVGEWLNPGENIVQAALSDLENRSFGPERSPRVLHLGPGISKLGTKLREAFVDRDWKGSGIVNVDFSSEAIRLGQEIESEQDPSHAMHWLRADLRAWNDMSSLAPFAPFDIILDKSTSDAIATSPSAPFSPTSISHDTCPVLRDIVDTQGEITVSPVELLALHLVPLTTEGTMWIALSYSTMRFDNLPRLAKYWDIVSRTSLKAPQGQVSSFAHTPEVFHWLYTLRRK
ncbi:hypothetical protein BDV32DRAFT_159341 [Aspergillus pseudonomiae]|uniref:Uncharacterized protein n=1 Tax=Aspergillus pseudonomiae TaxID=1506151 RepID=A0A5N6HYF4_9EURO|nr:uncharacterized protein BDV37DRAFT_279289 [Aspergillus pseudonomiae]KAB8259426.1 hypothetical protein BDV32DRAFT_159341 [Aspergillus pseudonomiae]KAE8408346.1 hypothetical protein BDV37DRAFT_279289 [Aspergillus pseudonomiae]